MFLLPCVVKCVFLVMLGIKRDIGAMILGQPLLRWRWCYFLWFHTSLLHCWFHCPSNSSSHACVTNYLGGFPSLRIRRKSFQDHLSMLVSLFWAYTIFNPKVSSLPEDLQTNTTVFEDTTSDACDDTNGSKTDPTLNLPIALRKVPRTCTQHPMSKSMTFSCLRDSYKKFAKALSVV